MQLADFRLFIEVAELGSFTKVAAHRQTVQSHISRQVSQLEKRCGGALFRRTGRGVELTEFGEYVAQRVRLWIKNTDDLLTDIQDSAGIPMGEVKLGILPSAAHPLMTHVYKRLQLDYPHIRLNIREGQGGELDTLLETGAVDMAILFRYDKPNTREETLLSTANTYLVSSPGLSLTSPDVVEFRRLQDLPLVLPRRSAHWRSILDETAKSQGFTLKAVAEADSLSLQKALVIENRHLYALLGPFAFHDDLNAGRLQAAKIVRPELKRYVTLARPKQGVLTKASRVVADLIVDTVKRWDGLISSSASRDGSE